MNENTQNKNINQTKIDGIEPLKPIETDDLKQGLLPYHFCEVTTDHHG